MLLWEMKKENRFLLMNEGKQFEQDFKKSLETYSDTWIYRPSDFGGGQSTRFTNHSLCDYMMFDYSNGELYLFELKSKQSTSISCPSYNQFLERLQLQKRVDESLIKENKKNAQDALKALTKKMNEHDIKYHQIESLYKTSQVSEKMKCYFVLNFRKYNRTFCIKPTDLINCLKETGKSSINIDDILTYNGIEIEQIQVRNTKHYFYDITALRSY